MDNQKKLATCARSCKARIQSPGASDVEACGRSPGERVEKAPDRVQVGSKPKGTGLTVAALGGQQQLHCAGGGQAGQASL